MQRQATLVQLALRQLASPLVLILVAGASISPSCRTGGRGGDPRHRRRQRRARLRAGSARDGGDGACASAWR
ncbi:MAG: hypothetical protein U1F25_17205 [Rubrivivax sp.]